MYPPLRNQEELKIVIAENTGQNVFWELAAHRPPISTMSALAEQIAYADSDAAAAMDLVYERAIHPGKMPDLPGCFGNDQDFCATHGQAYDPDKARALLGELGYSPAGQTTRGDHDRLDGWRSATSWPKCSRTDSARWESKANIEIMDIGTMNARSR